MAKKLKAIVKLQIEAGRANPAPPIGPALASHGINLMQFCKSTMLVHRAAWARSSLPKSVFSPMVLLDLF